MDFLDPSTPTLPDHPSVPAAARTASASTLNTAGVQGDAALSTSYPVTVLAARSSGGLTDSHMLEVPLWPLSCPLRAGRLTLLRPLTPLWMGVCKDLLDPMRVQIKGREGKLPLASVAFVCA